MGMNTLIYKDVQLFAILCVDSIDNDIQYHRESIKFSIKSLFLKYDD